MQGDFLQFVVAVGPIEVSLSLSCALAHTCSVLTGQKLTTHIDLVYEDYSLHRPLFGGSVLVGIG